MGICSHTFLLLVLMRLRKPGEILLELQRIDSCGAIFCFYACRGSRYSARSRAAATCVHSACHRAVPSGRRAKGCADGAIDERGDGPKGKEKVAAGLEPAAPRVIRVGRGGR